MDDPPITKLVPSEREANVEYLLNMIRQLARLAKTSGERAIAIHLEAIIAARRAAREDPSP